MGPDVRQNLTSFLLHLWTRPRLLRCPIHLFCVFRLSHFIARRLARPVHTEKFLNSKQPGTRCDSGCILIELCRTLSAYSHYFSCLLDVLPSPG
jgi:hypothetical protein